MDRTIAFSNPSGVDSTVSVRTEKSSAGLPSQAALYTTVFPSGAKRADSTFPRREVRRRNVGSGAFDSAGPSRAPDQKRMPDRAATATAAITRRGHRRRGEIARASGTDVE